MNAYTTTTNRWLPLSGSWPTLSTGQRTAIHLGLLGAVVLFVHFRTFDWLLQTWWKDQRYSHGFLIPLIACYLVWLKRDQLSKIPDRPKPAIGGLFLLASAILLLAGRAGGFVLLEALSLLILLPGIVLFVWGPGHLRALILPLAYLQFMIPWMEEFFALTAWPLQLLTARIASAFLQAMGFSVFRDVTLLQISHVTIEVISYCSGIGFLTSVIALGIPLVYLTQRTWWRAVGVLVCGVAITMLANGMRVALMGMMFYYHGESMLHGPLHILQGLFASQVGILFLFLINWGVSKLPCDSRVTLNQRWKGSAADVVPTIAPTRTSGPSALLILSVLGFGCYLHFFAPSLPVPLRQTLVELPRVIDRWHGRDVAWIEGSRFFPGVTSDIVRSYQVIGEKEIFLYVGYFASQRQGESLISAHSNPLHREVRELQLPRPVAGVQRVNHALPIIDGKRYEALVWYHLPSAKTTGRYETKLRQILDAVIRGHNNGAVVVLATPAGENRDSKVAVNNLLQFASVLAPVLEEYLP